jgi:hypothetical protein
MAKNKLGRFGNFDEKKNLFGLLIKTNLTTNLIAVLAITKMRP